jgi:hypothetical protein
LRVVPVAHVEIRTDEDVCEQPDVHQHGAHGEVRGDGDVV